ncbi:MAG: hypothetical protein M1836_004247 [Candelina mexicana]|nr:MAG: hypothetical protein M1836_004247 [Candelina mexicana]
MAVQSCARSLIVDTLPIPKQQLGSAWGRFPLAFLPSYTKKIEASRMIAIGHLIGYGAGTIDLLTVFGTTLGDSQFKQLTVIAAVALILAVGVTSYAVQERILIAGRDSDVKEGAVKMVAQIFKTTLHMPSRIQAICWIQFWAWIGWFPFLFYSTTWVGETYFRYNAPEQVRESKDALGDIGRVGSFSLVIFSVITFIGSVLLPLVVRSPEDEKVIFTPRPPASLATVLTQVERYKPDLLTAWTLSHFIFAGSMLLAPFVASLKLATILVSVCGLPWALACWAPFAFIGMEINKLGAPSLLNGHSYQRLSTDSSVELERSPSVLRLNHQPEDAHSSTGELAGIYLGILNLFTTLPQFVGTFISMIVFSILEPGKSPELAKGAHPDEHHSTDGPNAIAVCLFIGALSAIGAAYATTRLRGA